MLDTLEKAKQEIEFTAACMVATDTILFYATNTIVLSYSTFDLIYVIIIVVSFTRLITVTIHWCCSPTVSTKPLRIHGKWWRI